MRGGGPVEDRMRALMVTYAGRTRLVLGLGCLALGLVVVPGRSVPAAAAMVALGGWTILYVVRFSRARSSWPFLCDVLVFGLAGLTQQWTVPAGASADSTGWVLGTLTVIVVTTQWHTSVRQGVLATAVLTAAYVAGAWLEIGPAELQRLTMVLWLLPQAVLSRLCARAVISAARHADASAALREAASVAAAVAAARRADEREHQALLHDTVAATLLMVGTGAVAGRHAWLAEQAARDLDVLGGPSPAVPIDLATLLRRAAGEAPLTVSVGPVPELVLPAEAATAIHGGVREALANVARHAGVGAATVTATAEPLTVVVADRGCGFDPATTPSAHRRGVAGSIVARMAAIGGSAQIRSAPGRGTDVRLVWPDA